MESPYAPPPNVVAETSTRGWLQTVFAILTGLLSVLMLVGIASNCIIFARLPTWPTTIWQWIGIIAMTIVMLTTSIAFAHISIGLYRSTTDVWKRGLWILLGSVLGYAGIVAAAVTMRALT